jgi:MOSC domain-containing protein YiiM
MKQIGTVARLQVQRRSLKAGLPQQRYYDPSPIVAVAAATLSAGGVTGWDKHGAPLDDVHHRDHPSGKNRKGLNGISVLFTGHYGAMRRRFGARMVDGIAGESILVDMAGLLHEEDLQRGIVIRTSDGEALLEDVLVAEPCVEFTRFAIDYPPHAPTDTRVTDALAFLRDGMRGFYVSYHGEPVTVRLGDPVFL